MTDVTRLAAAAAAVDDSLARFSEVLRLRAIRLVVEVSPVVDSNEDLNVRTIERVVADVQRRFGVEVDLDWR